MKKKNFLVCFFTIISMLVLSACGSVSKYRGSFAKSEYLLSIFEEVDFKEDFSCKGVKLEDIVISFSNDLFVQNENGKYSASTYGQTQVYAKLGEEVLAESKVTVMQPFTQPDEITISQNGKISWSESYAVVNGSKIVASQYRVILNGEERIVNTNSFNLPENTYGQYLFQVQAMAKINDKIDASNMSNAKTLYYGMIESPENIELTYSDTFGDESVTLAWPRNENARYTISLDGAIIKTEMVENYLTLNLANYKAGESAILNIQTTDVRGQLLSSSKEIKLTKTQTPVLEYDTLKQEGKLNFDIVQGGNRYIIELQSLSNGEKHKLEFTYEQSSKGKISTILSSLSGDIYSLSLQTIGSQGDTEIFVSSPASQIYTIAKLAQPDIKSKVVGQSLVLVSNDEDYVNTYKVMLGNKNYIWNRQAQEEFAIDLTSFDSGEYQFTITALPRFENGNVVEYSKNNLSSAIVINSDSTNGNAYLLDAMSEIQSAVTGKKVTLNFDKVENADKYTLYINSQEQSLAWYEENGKIVFDIDDLSKFSPNVNGYNFEIDASREDDMALVSKGVKTLTILDVSTASQNQENGYFHWKEITGGDNKEYFYQIYKTQKDFVVSGDPLESKNTSETKNAIKLDYGYYVIRVYSKSLNDNLYLDSDFVDSDNYLQANIIVTEKILSPTYKFVNNNGKYQLEIDKVEFASNYEVKVNGITDGHAIVTDLEKQKIIYNFVNEKFEEEKLYNIEVIAHAGSEFDQVLHPSSDKSQITVDKMVAPTFDVNVEYDRFGDKLHELLEVEMNENANYVEIYFDGQKVNEDNSSSFELKDFNGSFNLTLKFIAKENDGNNYYLDSNEKVYSFKRIDAPTNIAFSSGNITLSEKDVGLIEQYNLTLKVLTENGVYPVQTSFNELPWSLSEFIGTMVESDATFKASFEQSSEIGIEISAFAKGENENLEGVYLLPSRKGLTSQNNETLLVSKLESPSIAFDNRSLMLSWNAVGQNDGAGTSYEVFVDGEKIATSSQLLATSISLKDIDFSSEKEIYIQANNETYLSSGLSNKIFIRKLKNIANFNVGYNATEKVWKVNFVIDENDVSFVERVLVNGSESGVNYNKNSLGASFNLGEVSAVDNLYEIVLETLEMKDDKTIKKYYISSAPSIINLEDISNEEFVAVIENGYIKWTELASDWEGIEEKAISYTLRIYDSENNLIEMLAGLTETQYKLDDLSQNIISGLASGNYSIDIMAVIKENFTLTSTYDRNAKGYYGANTTTKESIFKLEKLGQIQTAIEEDSTLTNLIDRKVNADIVLSWNDLWGESASDISFDINVGGKTINVKAGTVNENYSLKLINGVYKLNLASSLFSRGDNEISILVKSPYAITSDISLLSIYRFSAVEEIVVSQDGELEIKASTEDDANENLTFLVGVTIGATTEYFELGKGQKFDLIENYLRGISGQYKIQAIAFGKSVVVVASENAFIKNGYRMEGVQNVEIVDNGKVILTTSPDTQENTNFIAKYISDNQVLASKNFVPNSTEVDNKFEFALIDFIKLFQKSNENTDGIEINAGEIELQLALSKEDSINSEYYGFSFYYQIENKTGEEKVQIKRAQSMSEDYLVFSASENDSLTTTAFDLRYTYKTLIKDGEESRFEEQEVKENIVASTIFGYWVKEKTSAYAIIPDQDYSANGFFSKDRLNEDKYQMTPCYAINLNSKLAKVPYGEIAITISRIAKNQTDYYQFNETSFHISKLKTPTELGFVESAPAMLSWKWSQGEQDNVTPASSGYYVGIYRIIQMENPDGSTSAVEQLDQLKLVNTTSIDLYDLLREENTTYYVKVQAVSNETGVLCSEWTIRLNIMKYIAPSPLKIVDGKIKFDVADLASLDFVTKFSEIENSGDFFKDYANANFAPVNEQGVFTFSPYSYSDVIMKLRFENKTTKQIFYIPVSAKDLMPDLKDVKLQGSERYFLPALQNKIASGSSQSENVKALLKFYSALASTNDGIADANVLFDSFAERVPAGEYLLSVVQSGKPNSGYAESNPSAQIEVSVSQAPSYKLDRVVNEQGKEENFVTFEKVKIKTDALTEIIANTYKMVFNVDDKKAFELTISREDQESQWIIYYANQVLSGNDYIYEVENSSKVRINLKNLIFDLTGIERKTYKVSIFAQGNDYAINGKSDEFTLKFLAMRDFNLTDGVLSWSASETDAGILTKVIYERKNYQPAQKNITFDNTGRAELELQDDGDYNYVDLSVYSNANSNTSIAIESEVYRIKNLSKLSMPKLSVIDGAINVFSSFNFASSKYSELVFGIANDISRNTDGLQNYIYKTQVLQSNNYIYQTGLLGLAEIDKDELDEDLEIKNIYNYKQTEQNASEFYVSALGTSAKLATSRSLEESYNYLLYIENDNEQSRHVLLSSKEKTLNAKMLKVNQEDKLSVKNGDIILPNIEEVGLANQAKMFNKVTIKYYNQNFPSDDNFKDEQVVYTSKGYLDADLLDILNNSENNIYKIYMQKTAFFIGTENDYDYISLEGEYLKKAIITQVVDIDLEVYDYQEGGRYYKVTAPQSEESSFVLTSEFVISEKLAKVDTVKNAKINNGVLTFEYDNTYSSRVFKVIAQNSITNSERVEIEGAFSWNQTNYSCIFTPNEGAFTLSNPYTLSIYAYSKEEDRVSGSGNINKILKSNPFIIEDVYKLKKVELDDLVFSSEDDYYELDLSKYFENNRIKESNSCYKIQVAIGEKDEGNNLINVKNFSLEHNKTFIKIKLEQNEERYNLIIIDSENSQEILELNSLENLVFQFEVVDNQADNEVSRKILLNSDKSSFDISKGEWTDETLSWNEQMKMFDWSGSQSEINGQEQKEYLVTLTYKYDDKKEMALVYDTFYQPKKLGTIVKAEVRTRNSNSIMFFSEPIEYPEGDQEADIEFNLFGGGTGSEESPYIISNQVHFKNIALVNKKDVYFKQTADLGITLSQNESFLIENFLSQYDGQGKTLTINLNAVSQLNSTVIKNLNDRDYEFNYISSLFKSVGQDASIKNLKIKLNVELSDLSSAMIAPLAMTNYGKIENCEMLSTYANVSVLTGSNIALAGFVVDNYGKMLNIKNSASGENFNFAPTASGAINIMYGGIAFSNNTSGVSIVGEIRNCFISGEKQIGVKGRYTSVLTTGICLQNNKAKIVECGNDGNFNVVDKGTNKNFTSYMSGISFASNGTINFCYNNGQLISASINNNAVGIVYALTGGNLKYLVETANYSLVKTKSGNVKSENCYGSSSIANSPIPINSLTNFSTVCESGKTLEVKISDSMQTATGYLAKII